MKNAIKSLINQFLPSLTASPLGEKREDGEDKKVLSLLKPRSYATKNNKMKFSIIALHLHGVLQFNKTPHFVQFHKELENGDEISITSHDGAPSVAYATQDVPFLQDGIAGRNKRQFKISVKVPTGQGLLSPVSVAFQNNEDRDRVLKIIKDALETAANEETEGATVIAPTAEA